jgi:energy-coupling factor transporter ATP-binding protein EcfA2
MVKKCNDENKNDENNKNNENNENNENIKNNENENEIVSHLKKKYNFNNPILFNSKTRTISKSTIETLELIKSIDDSEIPIYENIFLTNNYPSKLSMEQMVKYYTTDTEYLEQTQQLIKGIDRENIIHDNNIDLALDYYEEIKKETGFCEKYFYFDFDFVKQLNKNPIVMTFTSMYNIISPIISLCIPILLLILPIILIKLQGCDFNFIEYINILKPLVGRTSIGSLFMNYDNSDNTKKIYLVISVLFYCFSIYQNILTCIRFYSNVKKIHNYLLTFKTYVKNTISNMEYFSSLLKPYNTYDIFSKELTDKKEKIKYIYKDLENITPFEFNYTKFTEIGNIMTTFYKLYDDDLYDNLFIYSFGFNGYLYNLVNINEHIVNNKLHKAKFINKSELKEEKVELEESEFKEEKVELEESEFKEEKEKVELEESEFKEEKVELEESEFKEEKEKVELEESEFKEEKEKVELEESEFKEEKVELENKKIKLIAENIFYPKFINSQETIIKNNFNLDKNIILTGPNASGKTTFIKSLFLNILLSQQIGYGCFTKLYFIPYDYFHCYLNIPDTSGRDSLFQAEARRCKDIIDFIGNNDSDEIHFCIFDELYSGTNPEEAVISADAFIKYLSALDNVSFSLTTHYVNLCEKIQKYLKINNCHMETTIDQETKDVKYTYKLSDGISQVKCGLQILKNMNYPSNILENL